MSNEQIQKPLNLDEFFNKLNPDNFPNNPDGNTKLTITIATEAKKQGYSREQLEKPSKTVVVKWKKEEKDENGKAKTEVSYESILKEQYNKARLALLNKQKKLNPDGEEPLTQEEKLRMIKFINAPVVIFRIPPEELDSKFKQIDSLGEELAISYIRELLCSQLSIMGYSERQLNAKMSELNTQDQGKNFNWLYPLCKSLFRSLNFGKLRKTVYGEDDPNKNMSKDSKVQTNGPTVHDDKTFKPTIKQTFAPNSNGDKSTAPQTEEQERESILDFIKENSTYSQKEIVEMKQKAIEELRKIKEEIEAELEAVRGNQLKKYDE